MLTGELRYNGVTYPSATIAFTTPACVENDDGLHRIECTATAMAGGQPVFTQPCRLVMPTHYTDAEILALLQSQFGALYGMVAA